MAKTDSGSPSRNSMSSDPNAIDDLLRKQKVLICAGTGGVGKTTISAALGVRGAELGLRVLVLTIDPARRLASALGLERWTTEELVVGGTELHGRMAAAMIDTQQIFDQFIRQSAPTPEAVNTILNNGIYKHLTISLSGSQEYSTLERLYQAVDSQKYDLIILDTPPSQHARDFLTAPERFYSLFQDSILKWFITPPDEAGGFFKKMIYRSTHAVFIGLRALIGEEAVREIQIFFGAIQDIQGLIRDHSIAIQRLLSLNSTSFVLVTSFDSIKLREALVFKKELERSGHRLSAVIINRAFPEWLPDHDHPTVSGFSEAVQLQKYYESLRQYYERQNLAFGDFEKSLEGAVPVIKIPEFGGEIANLQSLKRIAHVISGTEGGAM